MIGAQWLRWARTCTVAFLAACGSSLPSSSAEAVDGAADAATKLDAGADVPPVSAGLFMGIQGVPTPVAGNPTPFVLVGCPRGGYVEVRFYLLGDDGKVTDVARRDAHYTKAGIVDRIVITDDAGDSSFEVAEKDSFAVAPFVYAVTAMLSPSLLDPRGHSFVARMLNPAEPDMTSVGYAFSEKLVPCP